MLVHRAIEFAVLKHRGQTRKGTDTPYIVHPIEVMQILTANGCDTETVIAGILHDTVEDTDTTIEEIREAFGNTVAELVRCESEDKTKSWRERKQATIDHMKEATLRVQQVCCADKLSNLKSMYADLCKVKEKLWERFNAEPEDIRWYYRSIIDSLAGLEKFQMYRELKEYYGKVFE